MRADIGSLVHSVEPLKDMPGALVFEDHEDSSKGSNFDLRTFFLNDV